MSAEAVGPGSKGRRGPTSSSCAECKRLKIKCSRDEGGNWPCVNCTKRGCSVLCPNEITPETSRRAEAGVDALKRKNKQLTQRIKELEAQLAAINRDMSKGSSPAATSEGTAVDQEVESLTRDFGILKIEPDGRTIWHASHAPSDNFLLDNTADDSGSWESGLPIELLMLATSFPFTPINPSQCPSKFQGIKDIMKALAPPYDITLQVIDAFYNHTTWLGTPVPRSEVLEETVLPLHRISSWENVPAPRLAFFFSVLAVGVLVDTTRPAYDPLAIKMHQLASASLTLARPMEEPSLLLLQTILIYLYGLQLMDTRVAANRFWVMSGMAFRMVVALGIHRDVSSGSLGKTELHARRRLFWQLNMLDAVVSVAYGRPRFFHPRQYDCPFPDTENMAEVEGKLIEAQLMSLRDILIPALDEAFSAQQPSFLKVLDIDKRIRGMRPLPLTHSFPMETTMGQVLTSFCLLGVSQVCLMYLHRHYFFKCLNEGPDPMRSKYRYSFFAVQQIASSMVAQIRHLYSKNAALTTRLFFLWMHLLSALVVLAAIVIRAPGCEAAQGAMLDLDLGLMIFNEASDSRRVQRALPTVRKLRDKARDVLVAHLTGQAIPKSEEQLEQLLGEAAVLSRAAQMSNPFDNLLPNTSSSPDEPATTPFTPAFPIMTPDSFELPVLDAGLFGQDPALQWLTSSGAVSSSQPTLNHDIALEQPLLQSETQSGPSHGPNTTDLLPTWSINSATDEPSFVASGAIASDRFDLPISFAAGVAPDIDWESMFRDL